MITYPDYIKDIEKDENGLVYLIMSDNKKVLYDWTTSKNRTNPYYMKNCDDYDWFYKGN